MNRNNLFSEQFRNKFYHEIGYQKYHSKPYEFKSFNTISRTIQNNYETILTTLQIEAQMHLLNLSMLK